MGPGRGAYVSARLVAAAGQCLVYTRPWYYSGHWVEMTGAQFQ